MISQLKHADQLIAEQIHCVFQRSYQIEAELVGVKAFPPLARTINDIKVSNSLFYGLYEAGELAGVIEVEYKNCSLDIHSLTVDPSFFRRGIAGKLIEYVLGKFDWQKALVETALVNKPAIKLYEKYGFVTHKQWTPEHGIEKVAMSQYRVCE